MATSSVGGLVSGMDTNSIIESLVSIEKTQLKRLEAKKENKELYLNAYYNVNTMLKDFNTAVKSLTDKSAWNAKTTTSSDESIVKATATDSAAVGTYTFRVGQLATSAQYMGGGFASKDTAVLPSGAAGQKITKPANLYSKLSELNNGAGVSNTDTITIQLLDGDGNVAGLDTDGDGTPDNFAQFEVSLTGCTTIADVMNKVTSTADDMGFAITCVDNGDGTFGINYLPQREAYAEISANYTAGTYSATGGFSAANRTATINANFSTYLNGNGAYTQDVKFPEEYQNVTLAAEKWTDKNGTAVNVDASGRTTEDYFLKNGVVANISVHVDELAASGYHKKDVAWTPLADGTQVTSTDGDLLTFHSDTGKWTKDVIDDDGNPATEEVNYFRFNDDNGKEIIASVKKNSDGDFFTEFMDSEAEDTNFRLNGNDITFTPAHWEDADGNTVTRFRFTDADGNNYEFLAAGEDASADKFGRAFTGAYWATADGSATMSLADMAAASGSTLVADAWDVSALFTDGQKITDTEGRELTCNGTEWLDADGNAVTTFAFTAANNKDIIVATADGAGNWSFADTNGNPEGFTVDGKEVAFTAAHLEDADGNAVTELTVGGSTYSLVAADACAFTHSAAHYVTETAQFEPEVTVNVDNDGNVSWEEKTADDGSYTIPASDPANIVYASRNGFAADAIKGIKFANSGSGTAADDLGLTSLSTVPPSGDTGSAVTMKWSPGTTQTTEKGNAGFISLENAAGQAVRNVQVSDLNGGNGIYHGSILVANGLGEKTEIDLSVCATLNDIISKINGTTAAGVRAALSDDGNSLTLTDVSGGTGKIRVYNVGSGTTATDLKLDVLTDNGDGTFTGGNINQISETTSLSMLRNGLGINDGKPGNLVVQCDGNEFKVNLEDCNTIGDLIWAFESAVTDDGVKLGDKAGISLDGNRLVVNSVYKIGICSDTNDNVNNTTAEELGIATGTLQDGATAYMRVEGLSLVSDLNSVSLYNVTGQRSFNESTTLAELGMSVGQTITIQDKTGDGTLSGTGTATYTVTDGATLGDMMAYFNDIGNGANVSMYIENSRGTIAVADLTGISSEDSVLLVGGTGASILGFTPDTEHSVAEGASNAVRSERIHIKGINGVVGNTSRDAATGKLTANLGTIKMTAGGSDITLDLTSLGADSSMNQLINTLNKQLSDAGYSGISFELNSAGNGLSVVNASGQGVSFSNGEGTAATDLGLNGLNVVSGDSGDAGDLDTVWFTRSYALEKLTGVKTATGSISLTNTKGSIATVDLTGCTTIGDVIDAINDAGAGIEASINDTGDGLMLVDTNGGTGAITVSEVSGGSLAAQLGILGSDGSGYLNGSFEKHIDIAASDSLTDIMNNIAKVAPNVNCSIINDGSSSAPYRLVVASKSSGAANDFILSTNVSSLNFNKTASGQDAVMLYGQGNGASGSTMLLSSTNSNNTAILGLTVDLQKVSDEWVTITVGQDKDQISEAVESVVSAYNAIQSVIDEYDNYTYDEETGEKTKGIFFGDNNIRTLQNELQNMFLEVSDTKFGNLSMWYDLGVKFSDDGTLELDKETLADVIANNYDNMYKMLVRTGDVATTSSNCSATTTGAPAEGFSRTGAINGDSNAKTFGKGNGFESADEIGSAGYTYTVLFDKTRNLDSIYLYHVDTQDMPADQWALKDFVIEYLNPNTNKWEEMRSITDNKTNANYLGFGVTTACKGVRVVASSTNAEDNKFRLTEIVCNEAQGLASSMEKKTNRLTDVVDGWFVTIQQNIESEIDSIETQISNEEERLDKYEENLVTKYANMETVMSNLQSQAAAITDLSNASNSSKK